MMRFDAVLFDCDGTLVESEYLGNRVMVQLARRYGFSMSDSEARSLFRGRSMAACVADIEAQVGCKLPSSFVSDVRAAMDEAFRQELSTVPGVKNVLCEITVPMCIASGAPLKKIQRVLELTHLSKWFGDKLFSSYELDMWKPDPDLFLYAAKELSVEPSQCAVIEDSRVGVLAGVSAGMQVFHYVPDRISAFADHKQVVSFQSMDQLMPLLRQLR